MSTASLTAPRNPPAFSNSLPIVPTKPFPGAGNTYQPATYGIPTPDGTGRTTENPRLNTTEIWRIINLTGDTHPIHVHLVMFQVLDRTPFNVGIDANDAATSGYALALNQARLTGTVVGAANTIPVDSFLTGPPEPPAANETVAWKDTVQAPPGYVTRIIARFEDYTGPYVWHCHIIEHEENEMMRPYQVLPPAPVPPIVPVGGVVEPVNKSKVVAPYLALAGVVGAGGYALYKKHQNSKPKPILKEIDTSA